MKLQWILQPVLAELEQVEREIQKQIAKINLSQEPITDLRRVAQRAVNHLFNVPGKRLRPALVLLSARAVDGAALSQRQTLIELATATELVHSASLIHDDVIDQSGSRRNQKSLNSEYGNKIAVLVGDLIYAQFFALLTNLPGVDHQQQIRLFNLLCSTTQKMCLGEIYEEELPNTPRKSQFQSYLEVIEHKTASLMSTCCRLGAVVNQAGQASEQALADYGLALGMTYQLVDDLLDGDSIFVGRQGRRALLEEAQAFGLRGKEKLKTLGAERSTARLAALIDLVVDQGSKLLAEE